jgi:cytochrome c556
MKGRFVVAVAALALAGCAPEAKGPGAEAAHVRHEHFESLGKAFKALDTEAKKAAPDAAAMAASAATIDDLAHQLPTWFPAGSGPQDGVKTHAKPEVWTDADAFAERARHLRDATGALRAAAPEGVEAMRAKMKDVGAACGACHKQFRAKGA